MFDRIFRTNNLFDNAATSFGAFNKQIDIVARNKNFPEINRE